MGNFYAEIEQEYGFLFTPRQNVSPVYLLFTVAVRRKDIAEQMVNICINNKLTLGQAINLLHNIAEGFSLTGWRLQIADNLHFL